VTVFCKTIQTPHLTRGDIMAEYSSAHLKVQPREVCYKPVLIQKPRTDHYQRKHQEKGPTF